MQQDTEFAINYSAPGRFPLTIFKTPTTLFGAIAAALMIHIKWVSVLESSIGIGLILAILPWVIFRMKNMPLREQCGRRIKISKGFPNIVVTFESCGDAIDKGLSSDD